VDAVHPGITLSLTSLSPIIRSFSLNQSLLLMMGDCEVKERVIPVSSGQSWHNSFFNFTITHHQVQLGLNPPLLIMGDSEVKERVMPGWTRAGS
jgi:hypothetical protein